MATSHQNPEQPLAPLIEYHCDCVVVNREEGESQREWLKRCFCMFHWMQTDYYRAKLREGGGSYD